MKINNLILGKGVGILLMIVGMNNIFYRPTTTYGLLGAAACLMGLWMYCLYDGLLLKEK